MLVVSAMEEPSDITDSRLQRFYDYWAGIRAGRQAPARVDIDPAEIVDLLGYLNILEVQDNQRDFKVRLNGSANVDMLGQDGTGALCSVIYTGAEADQCRDAFSRCVQECRPVLVETSLAFCGKPYMHQTIMALPFSSDGKRVDVIVTAHSYHPADKKPETRGRRQSLGTDTARQGS